MKDQLGVDFLGIIKITDLEPIGYKMEFNLDHSENPIVLIADLPDDKFLEFVKDELRKRKMHKVDFYKALKLQSNDRPY